MKRITVAKGDGIGPEIMDATLSIIKAAGAQIEVDEIEVGEKVYLSGNTSGIAKESWDIIRRNKVFLKAPITTPQGGGYKSLNVTTRKFLGLYANIRPCISLHPFADLLWFLVRRGRERAHTPLCILTSWSTSHKLWIESNTNLHFLCLHFLLLPHLFLLSMAWHLTMELPAHLSECLLAFELFTPLIKVFDFNTVVFLVFGITKCLKLLLNSFLFVSTKSCSLTKHASVPEDLKSKPNSFANKLFLEEVLKEFFFFLFLFHL